MRLGSTALLFLLVACDTNESRLADLEGRLAIAEAKLAELDTQSAVLSGDVARHEGVIADLEARNYGDLLDLLGELAERVVVTADGDILLQNANLLLRHSVAANDDPNGKGNLILGFQEPQRLRCAGGANDGEVCSFSGDCGGSPCEDLSGQDRTGVNNLIVGSAVAYSGSSCIIAGEDHSALANGVLILGGNNVSTSTPGDVIVAP